MRRAPCVPRVGCTDGIAHTGVFGATPDRTVTRACALYVVPGPGDRPCPVECRDSIGEPALCQVARGGQLPVGARAGDLATASCCWRSLMSSPLHSMLASGRSSPVRITFRPRLPRFGQQFAGDTAVQHRRRVHHHDSALVPIRRPFFSQRAACTVAASLNPSAFRSCAPTFVGAKPITRRPARSMSNHWPLSTDHAGALKALRPREWVSAILSCGARRLARYCASA